MAVRQLTLTGEELVAFLDVWLDTAVQSELQGAHRNSHIYCRIMGELATRGFQRNVKQCRDKLKVLKRNIMRLSTDIGEVEQAWWSQTKK